MKTDKFDDSIRRKLESMDPAFREKDWDQMQAYMHQHAPASALPGAARWLIPSAAAAAIVALLVTTIWQYRTNQELRQSVGSLNKSLTEMQELHAGLQNRVDTVYITKYVTAPVTERVPEGYATTRRSSSRDLIAQSGGQGINMEQIKDDGIGRNTLPATPRQNHQTPETDIAQTKSNVTPTLPANSDPNAPDNMEQTTPSTGVEPTGATGTGAGRPKEISDRSDRYSRTDSRSTTRNRGSVGNDRNDQVSGQPSSGRQLPTTDHSATGNASQPSGGSERLAEFTWLNVEPLNNRGIWVDSAYYRERLDRRSRRIRSLLPIPQYTQAEAMAAEPNSAIKLRIGGSTELGTGQWSGGLYSEVLFGKHVTLGIGLNRLSVEGGKFLTDIQFNRDKKRDFRRDYANGIDPRHEILNINQHSTTWQVPVSLGYRIPLIDNIAITPSAGMNFSLNAKEVIAFTYRRAPGDFNETQLHANRPAQWFNSWTIGFAAEKQWKNLVFQASPYYSKPFTTTPFGLTSSATGLRVRILYQF
ncbi:hypothetical protein GCM10023189_05690 [Nibrella saemangeumensis]|uniref:Outer membrane protein beta-barrel domain-containing protein n=1 Tax=Nibrella saemangeumensis TaxID=1084526 RepID=A0ABP8MEL2_9BACT